MKKQILILFTAAALQTGCTTFTRLVTDTAAAGAGAAIGNELSDGDPWRLPRAPGPVSW